MAIERLRKSIDGNPGWAGSAKNWMLLAMADYRLGHAQEARQRIEKAGQ